MRVFYWFFILCTLCFCGTSTAADNTVRLGVLKYGTLNWELEVIAQQKLAEQHQINLQLTVLGSPQALLVALQGGKVDMILGDWLWAARQKENHQAYYYYPYSSAAGVLVTHPNSQIHNLSDLKGKTVGFAPSQANKNWILYRALIAQQTGMNIQQEANVKFASPPMLNALMKQGKMDAVVNFWHYAAELESSGMTPLITMTELLHTMGIDGEVPMVGWLFNQSWANTNSELVNRFFALSYAAKGIMATDDSVWQHIDSFTQKYAKAAQPALINAYRNGIPKEFTGSTINRIEALFKLIKQHQGDVNLTSTLQTLPRDIFWQRRNMESQ